MGVHLHRSYPVLLLACLLTWRPVPALAAGQMHLASLEWLPYVGPALAQGGLSGVVAATAASQFGYTVKIDYFPWKRAMKVGEEDADYAGYFPAYYTEERARSCHFSAPMGHSTIGLAYLKDHPLAWRSLGDLGHARIGVVAGYSNGREFDDLVKQGKLVTDPSPGDLYNLKKLLAGRVDAAVVDQAVMRYLLLTDPDLHKDIDKLAFHEKILAELTLHICFKRTPAGQKMQQSFDEALKHLDIPRIENAYFESMARQGKDGGR